MGAFGDNLRREREMRGVSLLEICQATKIGVRMLDSIETERFDRLPGGVFNAAFVRQYARYLGLDEDRTVAEFTAACGDCAANQAARETQQREAANATLRQMVAAESNSGSRHPMALLIATGLLIAGVLAAGGWRMWGSPRATLAVRQQTAAPVNPAPVIPVPVIPVPGGQETPAPAGAARPETEITLELEAKDRCTIRVSLDGRTAWESVMRRGSHRNLQAARTVQLTMDNAAALVVTRNGETLPSLGGKNEARTITFKSK